MAYPTVCKDLGIPLDSCDWLLRWSNPNQTYNALAFGKPEGLPFPADEVLRLNQALFDVGNSRRSAWRLLSLC